MASYTDPDQHSESRLNNPDRDSYSAAKGGKLLNSNKKRLRNGLNISNETIKSRTDIRQGLVAVGTQQIGAKKRASMITSAAAKKPMPKPYVRNLRNAPVYFNSGLQRTRHYDDDDSEEYEARYVISGPTPPVKFKSRPPGKDNEAEETRDLLKLHGQEYSPKIVEKADPKRGSMNQNSVEMQ